MKSVVWFKNSLDSLQSIYKCIYENSPQNAEKVVATLLDLGDGLAIFTERNPKEPLFNDNTI